MGWSEDVIHSKLEENADNDRLRAAAISFTGVGLESVIVPSQQPSEREGQEEEEKKSPHLPRSCIRCAMRLLNIRIFSLFCLTEEKLVALLVKLLKSRKLLSFPVHSTAASSEPDQEPIKRLVTESDYVSLDPTIGMYLHFQA
jgi:hypothetical protein